MAFEHLFPVSTSWAAPHALVLKWVTIAAGEGCGSCSHMGSLAGGWGVNDPVLRVEAWGRFQTLVSGVAMLERYIRAQEPKADKRPETLDQQPLSIPG